ncbi:MAG: hypothetical protein ACK5D5_05340 [Bacteroidota bacterium]|jgi:hypothetical protein
MAKKVSLVIVLITIVTTLFMACKKSEGDGVAPTYKSEATTTGNNPNSSTT